MSGIKKRGFYFPFKNSGFKVSAVVFYYRRISVVNLVREGPLSGIKKRGFLEGGFCKNVRLCGCAALSAKCTAGPNILGYFLFPEP